MSPPSIDPKVFAAAARVMEWHRQKPSWRPLAQPLPRAYEAPVPDHRPAAPARGEPAADERPGRGREREKV